MALLWTILITLSLTSSSIRGHVFELAEHDGTVRTNCSGSLNLLEFSTLSLEKPIVVALRDEKRNLEHCPSALELMAEQTAQALEGKVQVCLFDPEELDGLHGATPGQVHVLFDGRRVQYFGSRSSARLISFIMKLNSSRVIQIRSKHDKSEFECVSNEDSRVVGFFMEGTQDYTSFEEAAKMVGPQAQFFAVFDRSLAKKFKLSTVGQINLYPTSYKTPIVCPQNPAAVADIIQFVQDNAASVFQILTEDNINKPMVLDSAKVNILAIGDQSCALKPFLSKLLKRLLKESELYSQKLRVIWVDPDVFPSIILMSKGIDNKLNVPSTLPALGSVNLRTNVTSWFDLTLLNTTDKKKSEASNMALITNWFNDLIANNPVIAVNQSFIQQPQNQTVEEGTSVELSCRVQGIVGDCLWYHNGRAIGYILSKQERYAWGGDIRIGECSLVINNVLAKDEGEWRCEVTGENALVSTHAILTVQRLEP